VARLFCDIRTTSGEPAETDNREVLRRGLRRAAEMGLTFYVAPEIEYYHLHGADGEVEPHDTGGYFDQGSDSAGADLRRSTVLAMEEMGIPVKHSHHEVSSGQHEIDLRHTNALTMADSVITFKVAVKEIAAQDGGYVTFMPRPFNDRNGSGMHTHMSLFEGDRNAFFDADADLHLSETGRQFIAGLIKHAPEITAVTNQWVNSYKRLVPGVEAPVYAAYTTGNMGDLVRIPTYRPGKEDSVRVEYRAPDSACNPYLAFAAMLAAGLEGIEKGYELPEPVRGDVFAMSAEERREKGVLELPASLDSALQLAAGSSLLRRALGNGVMDSFLQNKRIEWLAYARTVTDYETYRYLKML
jgi:glutamine synthetase